MTNAHHHEPDEPTDDEDGDDSHLDASLDDIPKVLPHGNPPVPPSASDAPIPG